MIPFDDGPGGEADALRIANGTNFGLVAGVWTRDGGRALRMARKLHCGQVFINNYGAGGGIELPFGGVRQSGHGREKGFEALVWLLGTEDGGDQARLTAHTDESYTV